MTCLLLVAADFAAVLAAAVLAAAARAVGGDEIAASLGAQ